MVKLTKENMKLIAPLFDSCGDTTILSCLQGYMGDAWADCGESPKSAQIVTGDFCFFAGVPDEELAGNIPAVFASEKIIMIPPTPVWGEMLERMYGQRCKKSTRYALKKEPEAFDRENLRRIIDSLPEGYELAPIGERLYDSVQKEAWSKDFCANFKSYAEFEARGLGFVAVRGGETVCGASTYNYYDGGIEIEIGTKTEHRRKGIAAACAARLILTCLDMGLYPNWDAANSMSAALAQKLGYHLDREYDSYQVMV